MKILVGHNYYQQAGGEDHVFGCETRLLKAQGHDVCLYERRNDEIKSDWISRIGQAASLRWSDRSYQDLRTLAGSFKPDIAHFHNTFFRITPSAFYACKEAGIPVVVSLHNYRLMCINGLFFRDNHPCEDCLQTSRIKGVLHRCYRGSLLSSAALTDMVQHHWNSQTWTKAIDRIIVATEFSRKKHIQAGIPADMITVLPHFVDDPGPGTKDPNRKKYALYAGRLSAEKGVDVLLQAWKGMKETQLYIVGTGPLKAQLEAYIKDEGLSNVKMLGFLGKEEYLKVLSEAMFLVVPCLSYDNFPMVIVEAYSYGVPVLASQLGSLEEAIEDGVTGRLFSCGSVPDLVNQAEQMVSDENQLRQMGCNARKAYDLKHSPQRHYEGLMDVYQGVRVH